MEDGANLAMQVVYESYDAARAACEQVNAKTRTGGRRERQFTVYRVSDREDREKYVVALSPLEAMGKAAPLFGLSAVRWPPAKKESPQTLLDKMTDEDLNLLMEQIREEKRLRRRQDHGEES